MGMKTKRIKAEPVRSIKHEGVLDGYFIHYADVPALAAQMARDMHDSNLCSTPCVIYALKRAGIVAAKGKGK